MAATGEETTKTMEKEGSNLLGSPTFTDIENGRFRCVETGHELLEKDKESYSHSKRCRLGLIEYALSHKKPPLNLFKQDPNSRSKLICKLTSNVVNKSEEHIWKHINGKRFLHKLEEKELEKESRRSASAPKEGKEVPFEENGVKEEEKKKKQKKKDKKMKEKKTEEKIEKKEKGDDVGDEANDDDVEGKPEEAEFWMPPIGERWDFDDGGDRWGSGSDSEGDDRNEDSVVAGEDIEDDNKDSDAISTGKKRKSEEISPIGLSSKKNNDKKKKKKNKKKIEPSSQV